jgi:hypothetical protein
MRLTQVVLLVLSVVAIIAALVAWGGDESDPYDDSSDF